MSKGTREQQVMLLFEEHMDLVDKTVKNMMVSITKYLDNNYIEAKEFSYQAHLSESEADKKRRLIIEKMYQGAFLPVAREDLINYLAKQDKIADRAESTCDFLITQTPKIPDEFNAAILKLVNSAYDSLSPLSNAIKYFFTDFSSFRAEIKKVNILEEEVDNMEWHLTKRIFQSNELDLAEKIHLHELVFHIAIISDVAEDAADMLDSVVVKKKI